MTVTVVVEKRKKDTRIEMYSSRVRKTRPSTGCAGRPERTHASWEGRHRPEGRRPGERQRPRVPG